MIFQEFMKLSLSIIIPTFNEERYLPKLLDSLQNQTMGPHEVIVSDAFSDDRTRVIAKSDGCKVVDGGLPGTARNNGVKTATQPLILFLDADVILPPKFLEKTVAEIVEKNLDIASCFITPRSPLTLDKWLHKFANQYMKFTQKIHPHIPGACIFVKKDLHNLLGGFDESLTLAEDHDYVRRAKKVSKFAYLKSYKIPISVRRFSKEGRIKVILKYIAIELHLLFLGKIKKDIFKYRFSEYY